MKITEQILKNLEPNEQYKRLLISKKLHTCVSCNSRTIEKGDVGTLRKGSQERESAKYWILELHWRRLKHSEFFNLTDLKFMNENIEILSEKREALAILSL